MGFISGVITKEVRKFPFLVRLTSTNFYHHTGSYPFPGMDEFIDRRGNAKYLPTLDFNWGYCKIALNNFNKDNTTFVSHSSSYGFNRMSFGLTNAPETFNRSLGILFADYKFHTCLFD